MKDASPLDILKVLKYQKPLAEIRYYPVKKLGDPSWCIKKYEVENA